MINCRKQFGRYVQSVFARCNDSARLSMREMLKEIRDGRFAQEWVADARAGLKKLRELEQHEADSPTAKAGGRVIEVTKKAAEQG